MSKVFGIGWAKTGTTTLGRCLEILGYNHQTQKLWLAFDYGSNFTQRFLDNYAYAIVVCGLCACVCVRVCVCVCVSMCVCVLCVCCVCVCVVSREMVRR